MKSRKQKDNTETPPPFLIKKKNTRSLSDYERFDFSRMTLLEILAYNKHKKGGK